MSAAVCCTDSTALLNDSHRSSTLCLGYKGKDIKEVQIVQNINPETQVPKQLKSKIWQQLLVRGPTNVIFSKIDIILPGLQGLKETQQLEQFRVENFQELK